MITVDTSVVVPGVAAWHEHHEVAFAALERATRLGAHVYLEALSVLTRLPAPNRVDARTALDLLETWFPDRPLALSAADTKRLPAVLVDAGISGGAVYDGLVAFTAARAGHRLLTLDRRARSTYERLGVEHEFLA